MKNYCFLLEYSLLSYRPEAASFDNNHLIFLSFSNVNSFKTSADFLGKNSAITVHFVIVLYSIVIEVYYDSPHITIPSTITLT